MVLGRIVTDGRRWMAWLVAVALVLSVSGSLWAADKAADKADAHDHGGHAADPHATDPLSIDADLAFWTLIIFVVLLFVLKKFAWGPILDGLDKREGKIADDISRAESNRIESQKLLADYETKLAKAQEEVKAIIEEARRDAEVTKADILATARSEAAAEMARAKHEVEIARDQALQQLVQTSANLAVDLAGKIVQAKLNPADHAKLIAESVSKIPTSMRN
jgi:F-type H+-transporting ATPase subunit b